ncbi:occludin-like isoform X2 [Ahaetulla prasina]|uniref:occludin-like isoform X2 n=1 Tax=Ahaetulla prasina TaxID=499056 RepID=UPI0026497D2D|nr:occludin-like isoform X2 [Ahaetulla prasina]
MFSPKKPYDSPPAGYGPPGEDYGYPIKSPPPGSYYIEDEPQHFYKWTSPPSVVRILEGLGILLCVAIFACVASTLVWEYGYGGLYGNTMGGYYGGGYGGGLGSYGYGMGSYYGGYGMGGYYGGVTNPRAANGFMIAMSVLCFIALLALAITSLTKSGGSRSRRFYLVTLVVCALMAFIMLIASIVYIMGVNPQAQMGGSYYSANPMLAMCNQVYAGGAYYNQYLYHYCMVDPQEVKNVDGRASPTDTATLAYSEKPTSPLHAPASPPGYTETDYSMDVRSSSPFQPPLDKRARTLSSSTWEETPRKPPTQRGQRARQRNPDLEEPQYETDYTTAVESSDEQEPDEWGSHYPPITSDDARQRYKQDFDTDLKRYKRLCGEMDGINDQINQLSGQLDQLPEDTLQYQGVAEEYNRLKELKQTPDYQGKKMETKSLRKKLFHIKKMVSEYDKHRG